MEKLRLGAQRLGLRLTTGQLQQFQVYYEELVRWNSRMNLTTIVDYDQVQMKHFLDSLTVTLALPQRGSLRVIDVGTGAGLPGIPLKIALPDISLALLDSTAKKADFLRYLMEKLGLKNVDILTGRAEDIARQPGYRDSFDVALSRAVAPLPTLAELTLPFCAVGGICIAQKKGHIGEEIDAAAAAINLLGGKLREIKRIDLEDLPDERFLVVIDKISPTPPKYPRRPGMPSKRPLA